MEIVVATHNKHKLEEIRQILAGLPLKLRAAADFDAPEIVEDEPTLEGNARKKAYEVARATGRISFADDTGLIVDALGGRPGVLSARYAGPAATYADNVAKLLRELGDVPPERRAARFRCVIALARPGGRPGEEVVCEGTLEGKIALSPRGANGFGYDPVFEVTGDARNRTLAELPADEKNRVSHRALALEKLRARLAEIAT